MSEQTPLLRPQSPGASSGTVTPTAGIDNKRVKEGLEGEKKGPPGALVAAIFSVGFLYALDGTIVATLLTAIGTSFNESNMAAWLGTSYLLSAACFTPVYGRLSDAIGRRGAMMTALSFFGFGTLLCAVAPTMRMLIFARAICGAGGGGLTSVGTIIMSDLVSLKQRGLYQGYLNCLFALGAALGGPIGGFLGDTIGWRWAFVLQCPILLAAATAIWFQVNIPIKNPDQPLSEKLKRIDYLGSATLGLSVGTLLLALTLKTATAEGMRWSDPLMIGLLVGSAVSAVGFVLVEWKVAHEPIMPLSMMRQRNPALVSVSNLLFAALSFSTLYNIPLYFSSVRLTSSKEAGSHLIPNSIALALASVFAGWYMRRTGKYYYLALGFCLASLFSCILLTTWDLETNAISLWLAVIGLGYGSSGVITVNLIAMIGSVKREEMATATGLSYLFRTTGQVMGVQLSAVLAQHVLQQKLSASITGPGSAAIIDQIRHSTGSIIHLPPDLRLKAQLAYQAALHAVFICQVVVAVVILLTMTMLKEVDLPDSAPVKVVEEREEGYGAVERTA